MCISWLYLIFSLAKGHAQSCFLGLLIVVLENHPLTLEESFNFFASQKSNVQFGVMVDWISAITAEGTLRLRNEADQTYMQLGCLL
jgi:hypothetical protein